jgi:hypothetical protein
MAIASAIIAGVSLGYGVYAGETQRSEQRDARQDQREAQAAAEDVATQERIRTEERETDLLGQTPDLFTEEMFGDPTALQAPPGLLNAPPVQRPTILGA